MHPTTGNFLSQRTIGVQSNISSAIQSGTTSIQAYSSHDKARTLMTFGSLLQFIMAETNLYTAVLMLCVHYKKLSSISMIFPRIALSKPQMIRMNNCSEQELFRHKINIRACFWWSALLFQQML